MANFRNGNPKNPAGRNRGNQSSPDMKRAAKRLDAERRTKEYAALPFEVKLARQKEGGKVWTKLHAHAERAVIKAKRAAEDAAQDATRKAAKADKAAKN